MKIFLFLIFGFIYFIDAIADEQQECLESAMTQMAMNQCVTIGYMEAEVELNRVHTKIQEIYKEDELFLSKLKEAQLAWIKLRDADFDMQFPLPDKRLNYGSGFSMCAGTYKAQVTLQRIEFLKQWLVGSEKGDMCSGTKMSQYYIQEMLKTEPSNTQITNEPMDCSNIKFFGSLLGTQINEKGLLESIKYTEPLPNYWNDNSNLYSSFFVEHSEAPGKMIFKNKDRSILLQRNQDNTFDISKGDFVSIVNIGDSGDGEAAIIADFGKFRCQHIFKLHSRD